MLCKVEALVLMLVTLALIDFIAKYIAWDQILSLILEELKSQFLLLLRV